MRALFLSVVLGIAALGLMTVTPSHAEARPWHGHRGDGHGWQGRWGGRYRGYYPRYGWGGRYWRSGWAYGAYGYPRWYAGYYGYPSYSYYYPSYSYYPVPLTGSDYVPYIPYYP